MGRLFWKIFLTFWLTLIIAGIGVGLVVWWHAQYIDDSVRRGRDPRAAELVGAATNTLEHGGIEALKGFLSHYVGVGPLTIYAVNDHGVDILGRSVDPKEVEAARQRARAAETRSTALRVQIAHGDYLLLFTSIMGGPGFPPPPPEFGGPPGPGPGGIGPPRHGPPPLWMHLATVLLASLAFSALLAWYFVKPIRSLRAAFKQVAEGHLDTRVRAVMGRRRDELSDLGRDFDSMTGQLEGLIGAQKRLFHDVSHELRSPLARLHAAIGLARQRPEQLGDTLDRLEREAGRLDDLVGEVLTLARLDSGMAGSEPVEFDIADLLDSILDDVRFEAETLGSHVDCARSARARLLGQADLIGRAIENVIRNALRYTPTGGRITLGCKYDASTGLYHLSVCDQGPGVDEDELDAIFVPFHRGRRTKNSEGYGLGLAIARRAVEAHGGAIRARNRPEGGLCIEIELPAGNP